MIELLYLQLPHLENIPVQIFANLFRALELSFARPTNFVPPHSFIQDCSDVCAAQIPPENDSFSMKKTLLRFFFFSDVTKAKVK